MSAYNCWLSMAQWRTDIRRNEEFVFGDQFSDRVYDAKKHRIVTERALLVEQGLQPSQYNIIRNVLRTIVGVWSSNKTLPSCIAQKDENQAESEVLTATLHALYRKNELWKLDMAELLQLLISGVSVTKNHFASRDGEKDVVNDFIDPFSFFVDNTMKDPRYTDCSLVGYFYDVSADDIVGLFSKGSKSRGEKLRRLYGGRSEERIYEMSETFTDQRLELDFFVPGTEAYGLCRVIEIWRKESKECFWIHDYLHGTYYPDFEIKESDIKKENVRRIQEQGAMGVDEEDMLLIDYEWGTANFWKYYFLTPCGEVLDEGMNPYWHEMPPIVFELHDFFCGKIYPFVKDLIDTNKQINRLSAISELLSKYSAKSLLFMPTNYIDDENGYGIEYIQDKATDYDSVIPYKPDPRTPHTKPEYVNTVAQAFTPLNVVNMYLRLSENVSGVYGALQGQQPTSGTPAQMYAQQSQNSATSLNGIFEAINSFRVRRDKMNVQLMQQYYDERRYIFDKNSGKRLLYDPPKVKNIDVEIAVVENTDTPAYRLMVNDLLFQLKQFDTNNVLDLRGMIEAGNLPFKDKLLDYMNKREQEVKDAAMAGQPMAGAQLPPELQQELQQYQFSPEVQQQLSSLPPDVQEMIMQQAEGVGG
ncbi:hypothetical protein [Paludibacter sp. 221]|uniref:portal protein n=1 Tax=Paludibacter sp. 221 TaxID=2302939 RepID=UPI0013D0D0B0|nr:hypothetical protein [Paludibacter sp. 221]